MTSLHSEAIAVIGTLLLHVMHDAEPCLNTPPPSLQT